MEWLKKIWNCILQTLRFIFPEIVVVVVDENAQNQQFSIEQQDSDDEMAHVVAAIEGLLTEILVRLPVKSLLRFKSVSKEWLSIITSPQFRDLKSKRFSNEISGILLKRKYFKPPVSPNPDFEFIPVGENYKQGVTQSQSRRSSPLIRVDFVYDEGGLEVEQYCNGLLLVKNSNRVENVDCKYYVFNPTTKEHATLSLNRVLDSGELDPVVAVNLAFDPRKSPHYKLICIYEARVLIDDRYNDCMQLGIYSSETGVLRQIDAHFRPDHEVCRCCYWNGALNWIDFIHDGLYFNVDEERLGSLPMLPRVDYYSDVYDSGRNIWYFGESNDHMHLIVLETICGQFDIYEMDKGYSGWFVRYHVDLQPVLSQFAKPRSEEDHAESSSEDVVWDHDQIVEYIMTRNDHLMFGVLAVVEKDDDDDDSFLVLSVSGKAVRFNLKDESFTSLCDLNEEYGSKSSVQFSESLSRVQF